MIKHYCDNCGVEITDENKPMPRKLSIQPNGFQRLMGKYEHMNVEVIIGNDERWNSGDFCEPCVVKAVGSIAKQPRSKK